MQNGTLFGRVDFVAAEHRLNHFLYMAVMRQAEQMFHRPLADAVLRVIKNQIVEINGKFFSPFFIVIKQIAHFNIFEMLIMGGNFLPCPGFADQFCHFLPTPYLRPRFRLL